MKFFSRDSLVPDITGINKNEPGWESAKQTVADIDKEIRKLSSYNDTNKIPETNKDKYVKLIKTIYNDKDLKAIVAKLGRGQNLSPKETIALGDVMVSSLGDEISKIIYEENKKNILSEELIIKCDEIHAEVNNIITMTAGLKYESRLAIAESLRIDIQEVIERYEEQIKLEKTVIEKFLRKLEDDIENRAKQYKEDNNYPMKMKN